MRELTSKENGTVGLITYLRTHSTRIFRRVEPRSARKFIEKNYGSEYTAQETEEKKSSSENRQDAHEADPVLLM